MEHVGHGKLGANLWFAQRDLVPLLGEKSDYKQEWEKESIERMLASELQVLIEAAASRYNYTWETNEYLIQNIDQIKGKHIAVIGSETPWIEVLLLRNGAKHVTTVDYRPPQVKEKHGRQDFLSFEDFTSKGRYLDAFDGAFSYSSVEHSGLGRYGDQLNPWADVQTMGLVWCALKPGAYLFLGAVCWDTCGFMSNTSRDTLHMNAGRDYGRAGLARLFISYEIDEKRSMSLTDEVSHEQGFVALRKRAK